MASLNLGRVRINFKGQYEDFDGQTLLFYDAVTFAGSLYVVKVDSVIVDDSDTGNRPNTTTGSTSFLKISDGVEYKGSWQSGINYYKNQIVFYSSSTYIAVNNVPNNRNNPQAEINANTDYWQYVARSFGVYIDNYDGASALAESNIVSYNGSLYISLASIASTQNPSTNPELFSVLAAGYNQKNTYVLGTSYFYRDVVSFHGISYVVTNQLGTSVQPIDSGTGLLNNDWKILTKGFNWVGNYDPTLVDGYYPGDVISYDNSVYLVIVRATTGENPDNTTGKFTQMFTVGEIALGDLINIDTTGAINGSVLQYEDGTWIASEIINSEIY